MQKTVYSLFVLLAIFSLIAVAPSAFAEHGEGGMAATVTNAPGSSTPGCQSQIFSLQFRCTQHSRCVPMDVPERFQDIHT